MTTVEILGIAGGVGLVAFYVPQLLSVWKAERLQGFNLPAWTFLFAGVSFLLAQLVLLQAWTGVAANAIALVAIAETMRQVRRKQ